MPHKKVKEIKKQKSKLDCKQNGYYRPWSVNLPWEELQQRIDQINALRVPKPVVYTGNEKRNVVMIRGLEYYLFLRNEAARLEALAAKMAKRKAKKGKAKKK